MTIGIYGFVKESKIVYIGKSINIEKRVQRHFQDLARQKHPNIHFQRSFSKYGKEAFSWVIVEECEEKTLNEREKFFIDSFNLVEMGFNQNAGGDGGARVFGVNLVHEDKKVLLIAELLEKGVETSVIALEVFGSEDKTHLHYIGRIRRRELRQDLTSTFSWDERLNSRRRISDEVIQEISLLIEKGLSNKDISLRVFGDWDKNRVNYLTKIRKREIRKDITINYDW